MEPNPVLQRRLKQQRTREEVAATAQISRNGLYLIEKGRSRPRRATLVVLAMALGCTPEELTTP
jgi:DNA-binding XRE family transcriptional regulator